MDACLCIDESPVVSTTIGTFLRINVYELVTSLALYRGRPVVAARAGSTIIHRVYAGTAFGARYIDAYSIK